MLVRKLMVLAAKADAMHRHSFYHTKIRTSRTDVPQSPKSKAKKAFLEAFNIDSDTSTKALILFL